MAILTQNRILNLIPKISAPVTIHCSQGDKGETIKFTLVKGDELFVASSNHTATVHGCREDGANFGPFSCTLNGSEVSFTLKSAMTAVKGSAIAEVVIADNHGNKVGSANFAILVEDSAFPMGVTYSNDKSVYESILAYVQTIPAQLTNDYTSKINVVQSGLNNEIATRTSEDALINTRIDEIIAPSGEAPSAAEVQDIRVKADGTTAATAGNAVREQITELKNELNATVNGFTVTTSGPTGLYLDVGDTVRIQVESITDAVNAYITGHTSENVLLLTTVGEYTYTAQHGGKLAFYFFDTASMAAQVTLVSKIGTLAEEVPTLKWATMLDTGVGLERGTLDTTNGGTVTNNARLRTVDYVDFNVAELTYSSDYYAYIFAYNANGSYIGVYTGSGYTTDWQLQKKMYSPIDVKAFSTVGIKIKCVFVRTDSSQATKETLNLVAQTSIAKGLVVEEYGVGDGRDFSTFTDMLIALSNNTNNKVVYVYGGVYDIFEEIGGAAYIASLDITGKNWRDVSHIVPANTTIIGVGDVTLAWNPSDSDITDQEHAFLFSPLNLSGSCTIKNIKIKCSNCRYGIHDETSGLSVYSNGVKRVLENVDVEYTQSTYGTHYAYGAGHPKYSKYTYRNCRFSAAYGVAWSTHDWTTAFGSTEEYHTSEFEFENCVFWDNANNMMGGIRLSSSDTVGRLDDVKINGCVFNSLTFGTESLEMSAKQGYNVRTMLCTPYRIIYSDLIATADRIAPIDYLIINS